MNKFKELDIQPMPHLEEFEQNILGCLLVDGGIHKELLNQLEIDDFYSTRHQLIFKSYLQLVENDIPIDLLTVRKCLEEMGELENTVTTSYLTFLMSITIGAVNLNYHITQIKKASMERRQNKLSMRLYQATSKGNEYEISRIIDELGKTNSQSCKSQIIQLSDYPEPEPRKWLLENAIPWGYPTSIYADGGIGKSFLALYFATLASLGSQNFLGLQFIDRPIKTLYIDWELEIDEFKRRSKSISNGLNLTSEPKNLFYLSPLKNIYELLLDIKKKKFDDIEFIVIDSLGAAGLDAENVSDVIQVFNSLKETNVTTLIIDHQPKVQSQENYQHKTQYGSVYKRNLSRSQFHLSRLNQNEDVCSLMLKHNKSNFGTLLKDLTFDMKFQGRSVLFARSQELSNNENDLFIIYEAIHEIVSEGKEVNQKNIINRCKRILSRNKVVCLLDEGEGFYWDTERGTKSTLLYKPKILKSHPIYNRGFSILEKDNDKYDLPEVLST